MGKFKHIFEKTEQTKTCRVYKSGATTARLDFVSDSCLRVAVFRENPRLLPTFNIAPQNECPMTGRDRLSLDGFSLCTPEVSEEDAAERFLLPCGVEIRLCLNNFLLSYFQDGKLLFSDRAPLAYNFEGEFGKGAYHYVTRAQNEHIYGLGDKGGKLDKAGRAFRIETADCMGYDAAESDPLYKHIPFYICENETGCYGLFYDTSATAYIDLGKEINNYYPPYKYCKTEEDCLVYYVFFGTKLSVLRQFGHLCGKQAFPPKWSFDYCGSTMAYTDAENAQEEMDGFLEKLQSCDLTCKGFYLSSGYTSIGKQRYVFHWNRDKFPDPKGFLEQFAKKGIRMIPNIKPAFLDSHPLYDRVAKNGWFIKNPDGSPFVTEFWDGLGSYLDFTNPKAFAFWKKQVKETLLDFGIQATWNDNNEFDIRDCDALAQGFGGGKIPASLLRPTLTYLMVEASFEAQTAQNPALRPFLSTRSGGIGMRRKAQTWSGDNRTSFHDLRYCHYIGLTMSLSGLYFYGHDLGGFHGEMPSRELLLRWLQHGIFEPRFTIHSWNSDGSATMPWSYPDILDSVRNLFAQRKQLIPYLYNCAYRAVENEEPINAPLFLYYDDEEAKNHEDCMLVGRDILAAFVFDEGKTTASVYLPKGDEWVLFGKRYSGGQAVKLELPADAPMPYFVRAGSVLPTDEATYHFGAEEQLVFTVYPLSAEGTFESDFFDDDGESYGYLENRCVRLHFTVNCTKDSVTVQYQNTGEIPLKPTVRLWNGDNRIFKIKSEG